MADVHGHDDDPQAAHPYAEGVGLWKEHLAEVEKMLL